MSIENNWKSAFDATVACVNADGTIVLEMFWLSLKGSAS